MRRKIWPISPKGVAETLSLTAKSGSTMPGAIPGSRAHRDLNET